MSTSTPVLHPTNARGGSGHRGNPLASAHPLVPILLLAALLRFWRLPDQPVLYFDSGVYLGEARFLASAAQRAFLALVAHGPRLTAVVQSVQYGTEGHPPDIAKPGHAVLIALTMLLVGKTAFAGALVSALAGVGTVAVTYLLGARGWNRRVAAAAAILVAISGQDLTYSREALVESDGMFFAALAGLVYMATVRGERSTPARPLLLAGLLFGVAFTCNNRLAYLPAVLAPTELALWASAGWPRWRGTFSRLALLILGFVSIPALIELLYLLARGIGRAAGVGTPWLDYAQQFVAFTRMNPPDRFRPDEWPTYFTDLVLMDGPWVLALVLLGLGVLLASRHRSRADLLLLGSVLVPLALYSVYSTGEVRMRHFSLALPWVMLAAAVGLQWLIRRIPTRLHPSAAWSALLGVMVLLALPRAWELATPPNAMPAVEAYLASNNVARAAGTDGPVLGFYLSEDTTNARLRAAFVNTEADLTSLAETYPVLVVDMQAYLFPGPLTDRYDRATPLFAAPHGNATWYTADLLEHFGFPWGSWSAFFQNVQDHEQGATLLRVFDLPGLTRS